MNLVKLRVHVVGDGLHMIHNFSASKVDKWMEAFKILVEDAVKDQADLEIIVIRGETVEVKAPNTTYIS